jgi:putative NADPH-quinone reductase
MRGNTGQLTQALVSGVVEAGGEVETLCAYDLDISPCLGCFTCWTRTPGNCTHSDDMGRVLAAARCSDILVLATPVYVDGMTGQLKKVVDRLLPLIHGAAEIRDGHMRHHRREDTRVRTVALVSTWGFAEVDNFDPLIYHVKAMAKNLSCDYAGALTVPGGLMRDRVALISTAARKAGAQLAQTRTIPVDLQEAMHGHSAPVEAVVAGMNRYFGNDLPKNNR